MVGLFLFVGERLDGGKVGCYLRRRFWKGGTGCV